MTRRITITSWRFYLSGLPPGSRGVPHRFKNVGSTPGRILVGFTPAGIEEYFSEVGSQKELSPEIMTQIARRHGIAVL